MAMTKEEKFAKELIRRDLKRQGYSTYSKILGEYDLNLTNNPTVIGFMEPAKGRIVVNRGLEESQVGLIIRHEILHFYLDHENRLLKKLARDAGLDYDMLSDTDISDLKQTLYSNDMFNIAADYEISNRGYTDKDKEIVRQIDLNGNILSGLVTEDDHPDWVDMSVEEMYSALAKQKQEIEKMKNELNVVPGFFKDSTTFIGEDGRIYGV